MKNIALIILAVVLGCTSTDKNVPTGTTVEAAKAVAPAGAPRRIDVKVTAAGYVPASLNLAANEDVVLVFTRTEDCGCGNDVAIPSLGIKKPLPLNEPVEIPFKATQAGEVKFTCGMGMMQGTLVIKG